MTFCRLSVEFVKVACLTHILFATQSHAGSVDRYQPDISADLVAKVDDAKEKQLQGHDLDKAAAELGDVVNQQPDYYRALFNLGLIYQSQGKTDQSLQYLTRAKQVRDKYHIDDTSILNSVGWVYMQTGNLDAAETNFLEVVNQPSGSKSTDERALNNLGYLYLQKGQTNKARTYLNRSKEEYHSDGASKILTLVDEYDQNQREGVKEIPGLVAQIDVDNSQIRLHAVNALAFSSRYPAKDVVDAILQRLESSSTAPLSVQGEINCLIILSKRNLVPWTAEQLSRTDAFLAAVDKKQLSPPEQYSVTELKKTLQTVRAAASPPPY